MQPSPGTQEVIVYRNPGEQWYWHNIGEVWFHIGILMAMVYLVFWIPVFISFRKRRFEVPNVWHALILTLFWPITLPIIKASDNP